MLFDSHIHLDAPEFDADREAVIQRARDAGVSRFLIPAVTVQNFDTVQSLATSLAGSAHAYGIHPLYVLGAKESDLDVVRDRLQAGDAVAVGEIGLDGFVEGIDMAVQERFFAAQLRLARDFDLPVVLHIRKAQDAVLKLLRRFRPPGGIAHAFNGSRQQADQFIDLGFALGFGGTMSYSGSTRIHDLAVTLPLESLVLETDAPDIPPAWNPRGRNEPANLHRFAEILAELRGASIDGVIEATTRNACRVLRLR